VQRVLVQRTDTLRLLATPELDDFLRRVGDTTARLINMENYRRRRLFFETGKIDYSWQSAWRAASLITPISTSCLAARTSTKLAV
jgi:hypothetical protein